MVRLRKKLSALVLWCAILMLYLGGVFMLGIGLILASQLWWAAISQRAGIWVLGPKTVELLVMAVGLLLILIVPVFHHKFVGRSGTVRTGRRAETERQMTSDKNDPLMTP